MKRSAVLLVWLLVVAVVAAAIAATMRLSFGWAFGLVALALLANGLLADLEDELPGGFHNPEGKSTPRYAARARLVVRGVALLAALLILLVLGLHLLAPL